MAVELPGVVHVTRNGFYKLQTTRSWDYLGLSTNSPSNLLNKSKMGNGVIIGLLDTGLVLISTNLCLRLTVLLINLHVSNEQGYGQNQKFSVMKVWGQSPLAGREFVNQESSSMVQKPATEN